MTWAAYWELRSSPVRGAGLMFSRVSAVKDMIEQKSAFIYSCQSLLYLPQSPFPRAARPLQAHLSHRRAPFQKVLLVYPLYQRKKKKKIRESPNLLKIAPAHIYELASLKGQHCESKQVFSLGLQSLRVKKITTPNS